MNLDGEFDATSIRMQNVWHNQSWCRHCRGEHETQLTFLPILRKCLGYLTQKAGERIWATAFDPKSGALKHEIKN